MRVLESLTLFVFESIFAYLFIVLDFNAIFIWFIKKRKSSFETFHKFSASYMRTTTFIILYMQIQVFFFNDICRYKLIVITFAIHKYSSFLVKPLK